VGEDPFVVFLGDNLLRGGIAGHVEAFKASTAEAQILVKAVSNPAEFGIAELDGDGQVRRLVEKPVRPLSDLAILGVYMLRHRFFDAARTIKPSQRGELEITDAMQAMIDGGLEVCARVVSEDWIDTGSPADLLLANRMLLSEERGDYARHESSILAGLVQVAPGARLTGSLVRGPAIIGCDAEIVDSRVGPDASIGDGCRIRDAGVEGSIVMDGSVIEGVNLWECIIGKNVAIRAATPGHVLEGLLVGDGGRVELA
jgi:glucose-1-phosphate thymidylyltransferase